MVPFRMSGNPTIYGLLALSVMEIAASQKPGSPLAILQQPTKGLDASAIATSPQQTAPPPQAVSSARFKSTTIPIAAPNFAEPKLNSAASPGNAKTPQFIPTSNVPFRDVQSHWSQPFVELLATRGIISGYKDGTFQPDRDIQAAHFVMMLNQSQRYRLKVLQRKRGMVLSSAPPIAHPSLNENLSASPTTSIVETEAADLLRNHNIRTRAQAAVFIYRNLQEPIASKVTTPTSIQAQATNLPMPWQSPEPTFSEPDTKHASPKLPETFHRLAVKPNGVAQG